jgi:hypothetical protein
MASDGKNSRSHKGNGEVKAPKHILVIDVGGTKIKFLATGETEPRKVRSGKAYTAARLVEDIQAETADWKYDAISIGYPGLVGSHGPRSEPGNLGPGWMGFNYAGAFDKPVRIMNDASMQALGSYEGGRMLFLSLGTGLGSTLIADNVIVPLELGQLPYDEGETLGIVLGRRGLERLGKSRWREVVNDTIKTLMGAFEVDYAVVGGGNAKLIKEFPHGARCGNNLAAFRGGFRMWNLDDVPTMTAKDHPGAQPLEKMPAEWRVI